MRTLTCALVLGLAIGFSGCKKKEVAEEPPSEEAPVATPKPATPEPKVAVATPAPKPATPAPELAPPGVFYLITAVSVETSDGILGLKPGQMLKEVRPGVYKADTNEVTLRPDQVTNDLVIARRVASQDQQTQAAIQQRLAASAAAAVSAPVNTSASTASGSSSTSSPSPASSGAVPPEVAERRELGQKRDAIAQQASQVAAALNQASAHYGGNWDAASKKSPQVYQLLQQYNGMQRAINDLNTQISQIH